MKIIHRGRKEVSMPQRVELLGRLLVCCVCCCMFQVEGKDLEKVRVVDSAANKHLEIDCPECGVKIPVR